MIKRAAVLFLCLGVLASAAGCTLQKGGTSGAGDVGAASKSLESLYMVDTAYGWGLSTGGMLLRTTDGGAHWGAGQKTSPTVFAPAATKIDVPDKDNLFAVTGTKVYHTGNGGGDWNSAALPGTQAWEGKGSFISFPNIYRGYVLLTSQPRSGQVQKAIYRTSNSGTTWTRIGEITAEVTGDPTGMVFSDSTTGWITCSGSGEDAILLYKTENSGHAWKRQTLSLPAGSTNAGSPTAYPPTFNKEGTEGTLPVGFTKGSRQVIVPYTTTDRGKTWKAGKISDFTGTGNTACSFADVHSGWILDSNGPRLFYTNDGGMSWTEQLKGNALNGMKSLRLKDGSHGFAIRDGSAMATSDGGKTWKKTSPE